MEGKGVLLNCLVVRGGSFLSMLYANKCQEEVDLFSFQEYATFEISDTRTFIFISGIDCLLFVFNYRSVNLMLGNQFRVCLLYTTIKIAEINRFTSYISTPISKNLLEYEEAPQKWCCCRNSAFVKLPGFAYQL